MPALLLRASAMQQQGRTSQLKDAARLATGAKKVVTWVRHYLVTVSALGRLVAASSGSSSPLVSPSPVTAEVVQVRRPLTTPPICRLNSQLPKAAASSLADHVSNTGPLSKRAPCSVPRRCSACVRIQVQSLAA